MRIYRLLFFVFVIALTTTSCKVQDIDVSEVHSFKVEDFSKKEVRFKFTIDVDNPNWFKIKIKKSNIDLYVGGHRLGKAELEDKIIIPGKSSESHTVFVVTDLRNMSKSTMASLIQIGMSGTADVEAKGWVKAKALMIPKKVEVEVKESISLRGLRP